MIGANQCTRGPDAPPPGRDVSRDVPLVASPLPGGPPVAVGGTRLPTEAELRADAGARPEATVEAASGIACQGDGQSGDRVTNGLRSQLAADVARGSAADHAPVIWYPRHGATTSSGCWRTPAAAG